MVTWCERWNVKVSEEKTQAIYFSRGLRPPEFHLTLNERNTAFVNRIKYFGVIFGEKITWTLHIEMIDAKAFRTFIRIYSIFRSDRLSANIKLTLHKALLRSVMTYVCLPRLGICYRYPNLKLQRLQNKVLRTTGKFRSAHQSASCR
jgi:hypothetical protein